MFKKTLLQKLKSLSPQEKEQYRDFLDNDIKANATDTQDSNVDEQATINDDMQYERHDNQMSDNDKKGESEMDLKKKDVKKEEVNETLNNEVKEEKELPKGEEEGKEKVETEETVETEQPTDEPEQQAQVNNVESQGNGIRIEDLVTKEDLNERFSALEAKFAAVVKENQDLKEKYENQDFGTSAKKGVDKPDKDFNSSFDEYSSKYM